MKIDTQRDIPTVEALLRDGPQSSIVLAKQLEQAGLSADAARQRISRARPPVRRLSDILLPHRGKILYLAQSDDTQDFVHAVAELLIQSKSIYGLALRSLNSRGGSVPLDLFNTVSGCPTRMKKQVGSERVLSTLRSVGLVKLTTVPGVGDVISTAGSDVASSTAINELRAKLKAEQIVLCELRDWLRKLGFVSYDTVEIRGDVNRKHFGHFEWDPTAPSYIHPLVRQGESGRPVGGFFVADVFLGAELGATSVDYFTHKFEAMRSQRNTRPFMAMLVADHFDKEAFTKYKSKGVLLGTVGNIFGSEVAEALRLLIQVLSDAAIAVKTEPEKLYKMLDALSKIEGAAPNVRSDLFEVVVGYCIKEVDGSWVDIRLNIIDPTGERAEVDVLSKKRDFIRVIECKGIRAAKKVGKAELEEWLTKKVPRIHGYITNRPDMVGRPVEFSLWTTGGFDDDALDYLRERQSRTKRYTISWKDGSELRAFLQERKLQNIRQIIDNHFFF